jgi:hypothetical protein
MDMQIYFKQKYLKYKQKYLENKIILGGGPMSEEQRKQKEQERLEQERLEQERLEQERLEQEQKNKKDMIFSLNYHKLKNEDCRTKVFNTKRCENAIFEFNNYIEQEINYLSTNNNEPVISALNKLLKTVSMSSGKDIINEHIKLRNSQAFTGIDNTGSLSLTPTKLYISLLNIKRMIKSL